MSTLHPTPALRVRPTAVAGAFYPARADQLAQVVDACLREGRAAPDISAGLRAVVVPHAGYVYSGPVAGHAYAQMERLRGYVDRVILLGPAHYVPVRGLAVPSVDSFDTPFGPLLVDGAAREQALAVAQVHVDDVAHEPEHSLEVQLPFLWRTLGDVPVLPVIVGRASAADVADVLDLVGGFDRVGPQRTMVVVSSDLSHYLDYETAQQRDWRTAEAVLARRWSAVADEDACGARPLRGLLECALRRDLGIELLDLRNSGDTAGPQDRVVGYGAFAVVAPPWQGERER